MTKVLADISKNGEHIFVDVASGNATNGLPVGGTTDQVLAKIDSTDYNAEWVDAGSGYILPTASSTVLGGIKVGSRLSIASGVLSADVQTTDISGKEDKSNKVTSLSGSSTDVQYPSAKLVYDQLALKEPNLPATPTSPDTKFLNGNRQWAEVALGSSGYTSNNYFTTLDSDISGYKQISYTNDIAETELTITVNNQELLARTYLYNLPLGVAVIDAGTWHIDYRIKVNNTAGNTQLKFEAFVRHSNGTETTLFNFYTPTIENTTYQTLELDSIQPNFTVLATDRLGVRIYAKTTVAANIIVYTVVGDGSASYFTTPLALRHIQLRGLNDDENYQHITSTEKSAITHTNRSSLDLVSGTNTGDNAVNSNYSGLVTNATHTGDVTGSTVLTIGNAKVTNDKMANMAVNTIKGRITASTGVPEDLTAANVRTIINVADGANNYSLPTASTTVLGGVKVDGTTVTIANGVISSAGGGTSLTKATGTEINTGTDDDKYVTCKSIEDSYLIESSNNTIQDIKSMTKADYTALADKTGLIVTTDEPDTSILVIDGFESTSATNAGSANNDKVLNDTKQDNIKYSTVDFTTSTLLDGEIGIVYE